MNVGLAIQAVADGRVFRYASPVATMTLRVTSRRERGNDLEAAVDAITEAWADGRSALVHCRASYHRGPLAAICVLRPIGGRTWAPEVLYEKVLGAIQFKTSNVDLDASSNYPTGCLHYAWKLCRSGRTRRYDDDDYYYDYYYYYDYGYYCHY